MSIESLIGGRLERDAVADRTADLVVAAMRGDDALRAALDGVTVARPASATAAANATPTTWFLGDVEVAGFRGIAGLATLKLIPKPGLTLVVGRNGSGKSTFAEAAEFGLAGTCSRWEERTTVDWRNGWRNLHFAGTRRIQVELRDDTGSSTKITRQWAADVTEVADADVTTAGARSLDDMGLGESLAEFRPILSYNELGELLHQRPVDLHDAIGHGLGTDEIDAARERLRKARLDLKKVADRFKALTHSLVDDLASADDERAVTVRPLLVAKAPDLEAIATALGGGPDDHDELANLERLAALTLPDPATVATLLAEMEAALDAREAAAQTASERADLLAELLTRALSLHDHHPEVVDCPVCGNPGVIDDQWSARTQRAVGEQRQLSAALRDANALVDALDRALLDSIHALPGALQAQGAIDVTSLRDSWQAWTDLRAEPDQRIRAKHFESRLDAVRVALDAAAGHARAELERRSAAWAPFAVRIGEWIGDALDALAAPERTREVTAAEDWLKDAVVSIRAERLAPIVDRVREIWDTLRRDSNVELADIELTGTGNARKAKLGVTVDGAQSVALSVMSQGELHALALSLFLPRATLDSSPFRFVIVDDPVQAMDSARVEGLARVLDSIATTRQVIVFTHDERLPRACRHLGVDARIIEVTRDAKSIVSTKMRAEPAENLVEDAHKFLKDRDLPAEIRGRVVPGLCRQAIEAAAIDVVWRRGLRRAKPHAQIEAQFEQPLKLKETLGLAMFGDRDRAGDVLGALNGAPGSWAADAVQQADRGMHGDATGIDLSSLVDSTRKLIDFLDKKERE